MSCRASRVMCIELVSLCVRALELVSRCVWVGEGECLGSDRSFAYACALSDRGCGEEL